MTEEADLGKHYGEKDRQRELPPGVPRQHHIQPHLPLPEPSSSERPVGEVMAMIADGEQRPTSDQP